MARRPRRGEAPEEVVALGAMSGTSLDGVDAAVLRTDGERIIGFGPVAYRACTEDERAVLRAALGRWPGEPGVAEAATVVEAVHAALLARFEGVAMVGFHGQTLAHDPGGRGTHQAGDGAKLAEALGLPVVWDFRSADIGLGGQGAPLAPAYHFALAKWLGAEAPVAFLNLGGVGNLTWVDPRKERPEEDGALVAFDTGPANAPVDDLVAARLGRACDTDGALAATGRADAGVLERFAARGWFRRMPPKALDRGDFAWLAEEVAGLSDADAVATLTAAAAAGVALGAEHFPQPVTRVIVCGGGRRNPVLMEMIRQGLECDVVPAEAVGLDGDMVEAQAFAHLAVRVLRGLPTSFPSTTGVAAPVGGGEISRPA